MRLWLCALACSAVSLTADLRIGIVGTDTSHVPAMTRVLNDPSAREHVPGARVVAAYKGGTALPASANRVDKFAQQLQSNWGVEIVPDIPSLCRKVDAILLESVDGRIHLQEVKQIAAAKKRVFIDKPLACTLEDAREIARVMAEAGVPWWSSSSLRYGEIPRTMKYDDAHAVVTWAHAPLEPLFPLDLTWYGIHPIEELYALMGPGCVEVTRTSGRGEELLVGRWKDGRMGIVHVLLPGPGGAEGAVVFRPGAVVQSRPKMGDGFAHLIAEIVKFFQTGTPPVPNEETLEIFAFMDAAQRSKVAGGQPMRLR
jgi:hypothetical protein